MRLRWIFGPSPERTANVDPESGLSFRFHLFDAIRPFALIELHHSKRSPAGDMSSKKSSSTGSGSSGSISASFLGLKAELERSKASTSSSSASSVSTKRKSSELDERPRTKKLSSAFRSQPSSSATTKPNKSPLSSGSGSSSSKRKSRPSSEDTAPSSSQLDTIRRNLERKARIYAQLQAGKYAGIPTDQLQQGSIDWDRKLAEAPHCASSSDDDDNSAPVEAHGYGQEEMVEYVDEFGRTRTAPLSEVPRELLPASLGGDKEDEEEEVDNAVYGPATNFPVYDPALHRREKAQRDVKPAHFSAGFENRHRGAAFYRFSEHEPERQQQMRQLNELRAETIANRRHASAQYKESRDDEDAARH